MLLEIVGCLLVATASHAPLRLAVVAAGLVSMLSFVAVAYVVGDLNAELYQVIVDLVASLLSLGAGVIIFWWDSGGAAA